VPGTFVLPVTPLPSCPFESLPQHVVVSVEADAQLCEPPVPIVVRDVSVLTATGDVESVGLRPLPS
jgi:hypothetical protein